MQHSSPNPHLVLENAYLLRFILHDQDAIDLFHCSLVSRTFESVASPFLWRHFVIGTKRLAQGSPSSSPRKTPASSVMNRYTKVLTIRPYPAPAEVDVYVRHRLGQRNDQVWVNYDLIASIPLFPNLHTLILPSPTMRDRLDWPALTGSKPRHLVVWVGNQTSPAGAYNDFHQRFRSIEKLTLVLDYPRSLILLNNDTYWDENPCTEWIRVAPDDITLVLLPSSATLETSPDLSLARDPKRLFQLDTISLAPALTSMFLRFHGKPCKSEDPRRFSSAKLRIFDLQLRSPADAYAFRLEVRDYMIRILMRPPYPDNPPAWAKGDFDPEQICDWFDRYITWGGIHEFLDNSWDDVFEPSHLQEIVKVFRDQRESTVHPIDLAAFNPERQGMEKAESMKAVRGRGERHGGKFMAAVRLGEKMRWLG